MSQESPQLIGGFRADLSSRDERAAGHRSPDERLLVRFPAVYPYVGRFWSRLPPRSRLRRMMLSRGVPRTCAALNRRDFAAFLVGIHPGIEFRGTRDVFGPDQTEAAHGHTGVLEFLQAWFDAIGDLRYDPEEVLDLGDRFLVTMRMSGHGSGSGVAVSRQFFVLSHLRRGWVVKQENFLDRSTALEAAGVRQ